MQAFNPFGDFTGYAIIIGIFAHVDSTYKDRASRGGNVTYTARRGECLQWGVTCRAAAPCDEGHGLLAAVCERLQCARLAVRISGTPCRVLAATVRVRIDCDPCCPGNTCRRGNVARDIRW